MPVRELVQQVGRRLADALAQAVRRGLQPPAFHLPGDFPGPGGQALLVMADPVRLPPAVALVSGGPGALVGLKRRASR